MAAVWEGVRKGQSLLHSQTPLRDNSIFLLLGHLMALPVFQGRSGKTRVDPSP